MGSEEAWLSPRDLQNKGRVRLFCLPHAGAGTAAYYRWRAALPKWVALCPIHLPGREKRTAETPFRDLDALIDQLAPALLHVLDRPFALFGHSMGALLAYEWAMRLHQIGAHPELVILSGRNAPDPWTQSEPLHHLDDDALVTALSQRYGAAQGDLLSDPELRQMFLPVLRADLAMVHGYSFCRHPTLDCQLIAAAGSQDRSVTKTGLAAWASFTAGCFETAFFPGDHFYLHGEGQKALLTAIAGWLTD